MFLLQDKVYRIVPGVVIMFNRQEMHDRDLASWNKGFRHLWLHSSNQHAITSNLNAVDKQGRRVDTPLKLISGHNPQLLTGLWDLCAGVEACSLAHWEFLKSVVTTCFFESLSDWQHRVLSRPQELVVESLCQHIQKNLNRELTLETLSRFAGYSPYFLHRIFRRHTGQSLHRYVVEERLEEAKRLLSSGLVVNFVSEQVGMPSPSYFSRFFKKHTGCTPNWWREVHEVQK